MAGVPSRLKLEQAHEVPSGKRFWALTPSFELLKYFFLSSDYPPPSSYSKFAVRYCTFDLALNQDAAPEFVTLS